MESPSSLTPFFHTLTLSTRRAHRLSYSPSSTQLHRSTPTPTQKRHHQTARRNRKTLNIPPAPSFGGPPPINTGGSGRSHRPTPHSAQGDTIVFNPPSAAPNVYHTPPIFLPREDPRRKMLLRDQGTDALSPSAGTAAYSAFTEPSSEQHSLPPQLTQWKPHEKKYHLGPAQIEEMRRLRQADNKTWTRAKLAEKFQCSNLFVATVVEASEEWKASQRKRVERRTRVWGPRRRKARVERRRRKEAWGRE